MTRSSRTFAVNLSASGVEMFLDCHHRLCRQTAELLPYGQTLFSALIHLNRLEAVLILDDLSTLKRSGLLGDKTCFVGAPMRLAHMATQLVSRVNAEVPSNQMPVVVTKLFVVALKRFRLALPDEVQAAYADMVADAGDYMKVPGRRRTLAATDRVSAPRE